MLALMVLLMVVSALAAWFFVQKSTERVAVVGVVRDVAWGQQIQASDLVAVEVVSDPSLKPVSWDQRSALVGQRAATDLQAGTLLTARSVTDVEVPAAGKALVGVQVKSGQVPVTPLAPQDGCCWCPLTSRLPRRPPPRRRRSRCRRRFTPSARRTRTAPARWTCWSRRRRRRKQPRTPQRAAWRSSWSPGVEVDMLIAVVSSKNSPGATTTSLALTLAWPRPALLAELDPRGGDILWGYGRGQNVGGAGLLRLQLTSRAHPAPESVWAEVIELPGSTAVKGSGAGSPRWWLPGLTEPRQVGTVNWSLVLRLLRSVGDGVDVVADCGSVHGDAERTPRPVWAGADLVVLTVRPTLAGVHAARNAAEVLREDLMASGLGPDRLVSVVVNCPYGYPLGDVVDELQDYAPVLGELPFDPDAADTLGGLRDQRPRFAKSSLLRHAGKIAAAIGTKVLDSTPPVAALAPAQAAAADGSTTGLDRTVPPAISSSRNARHPVLPERRVVTASPPPPVPRPPSSGTPAATATGRTT